MEILRKGTVSVEFQANHPKFCGNCAFPQNFQTRKLSEITLFYTEYAMIRENADQLKPVFSHILHSELSQTEYFVKTIRRNNAFYFEYALLLGSEVADCRCSIEKLL